MIGWFWVLTKLIVENWCKRWPLGRATMVLVLCSRVVSIWSRRFLRIFVSPVKSWKDDREFRIGDREPVIQTKTVVFARHSQPGTTEPELELPGHSIMEQLPVIVSLCFWNCLAGSKYYKGSMSQLQFLLAYTNNVFQSIHGISR